jgi:signal recognition particle receptor subunit alpha
MLDKFVIFCRNGVVLFEYETVHMDSTLLNEWIGKVLLEERTEVTGTDYAGSHCIRYELDNAVELIFVAVHMREFNLSYVDTLLRVIRREFCAQFEHILADRNASEWWQHDFASEFRDNFNFILRGLEKRAVADKKDTVERASENENVRGNVAVDDDDDTSSKKRDKMPRRFEDTKKGKRLALQKALKEQDDDGAGDGDRSKEPQVENKSEEEEKKNDNKPVAAESAEQKRKRIAAIVKAKRMGGGGGNKRSPSAKAAAQLALATSTKKHTKKAKRWDDYGSDVSKPGYDAAAAAELDHGDGDAGDADADVDRVSLGTKDFNFEFDVDEDELLDELLDGADGDDASSPATAASSAPKKKGFFAQYFGGLTNRVIEQDDLAPVIAHFEEHLKRKNVAAEIASKLCESVAESMVGKTLPSLTRMRTVAHKALEAALVRLLTPKRRIDILREVQDAKATRAKPYVIVFCGVNGVGKSTSLAKIASWLHANGLSVLIVACDTFRSGAVEQLGVHSKRLGIPLFERGYGKNAARIAEDAVRSVTSSVASKKRADVVLVDTAGRMQDNAPLMQSLCQLIDVNEPDLILFVGEALVGNDGVDQLAKFNQAMRQMSSRPAPRLIDGIVLTKFDTIDDQVGAALSMVYTTGQPIVFLGTGQDYSDLKRMNPLSVARVLLK